MKGNNRSVQPEKKTIRNNVDMVASIIDTGQKIFNTAKHHWEVNFTYTVTITDNDPLYNEVLDWLTSILPNEKHHALTVSSSKNPRSHDSPVSDRPETEEQTSLIIRFDQSNPRSVIILGHKVTVSVVTPENDEKAATTHQPSKIIFHTTSHAAQMAVLKEVEIINNARGKSRKAVLRMVSSWGQWVNRSDLPPRSMASVSLPKSQKDLIVNDLKIFLESEDKYNRLAIPWHRGYMLYGPPGTGKTSLVKALANEFNLDLWYISLSDLKAEASLISLMSEVGPRSILLLEDIDTIQITHDRDTAEQGKISLSSLLNTLDGIATPHGLIAFMTTNRFEVLDSALTRAGRMDVIEELTYPSVNTISDLFKHFYGHAPKWGRQKDVDWDAPIDGLSTAQIAEIMKRYMDDYKTASQIIAELISDNT